MTGSACDQTSDEVGQPVAMYTGGAVVCLLSAPLGVGDEVGQPGDGVARE